MYNLQDLQILYNTSDGLHLCAKDWQSDRMMDLIHQVLDHTLTKHSMHPLLEDFP